LLQPAIQAALANEIDGTTLPYGAGVAAPTGETGGTGGKGAGTGTIITGATGVTSRTGAGGGMTTGGSGGGSKQADSDDDIAATKTSLTMARVIGITAPFDELTVFFISQVPSSSVLRLRGKAGHQNQISVTSFGDQ
jgi:hypothetical protein